MRMSLTRVKSSTPSASLDQPARWKRLHGNQGALPARRGQRTARLREEIAAALLVKDHQELVRRGLAVRHPGVDGQAVGVASGPAAARSGTGRRDGCPPCLLVRIAGGLPGGRIRAGVRRVRRQFAANEFAVRNGRLDLRHGAQRQIRQRAAGDGPPRWAVARRQSGTPPRRRVRVSAWRRWVRPLPPSGRSRDSQRSPSPVAANSSFARPRLGAVVDDEIDFAAVEAAMRDAQRRLGWRNLHIRLQQAVEDQRQQVLQAAGQEDAGAARGVRPRVRLRPGTGLPSRHTKDFLRDLPDPCRGEFPFAVGRQSAQCDHHAAAARRTGRGSPTPPAAACPRPAAPPTRQRSGPCTRAPDCALASVSARLSTKVKSRCEAKRLSAAVR